MYAHSFMHAWQREKQNWKSFFPFFFFLFVLFFSSAKRNERGPIVFYDPHTQTTDYFSLKLSCGSSNITYTCTRGKLFSLSVCVYLSVFVYVWVGQEKAKSSRVSRMHWNAQCSISTSCH